MESGGNIALCALHRTFCVSGYQAETAPAGLVLFASKASLCS